jgi:hypothetical protein
VQRSFEPKPPVAALPRGSALPSESAQIVEKRNSALVLLDFVVRRAAGRR